MWLHIFSLADNNGLLNHNDYSENYDVCILSQLHFFIPIFSKCRFIKKNDNLFSYLSVYSIFMVFLSLDITQTSLSVRTLFLCYLVDGCHARVCLLHLSYLAAVRTLEVRQTSFLVQYYFYEKPHASVICSRSQISNLASQFHSSYTVF